MRSMDEARKDDVNREEEEEDGEDEEDDYPMNSSNDIPLNNGKTTDDNPSWVFIDYRDNEVSLSYILSVPFRHQIYC